MNNKAADPGVPRRSGTANNVASRPTARQVIVNGVRIDFFDDLDPIDPGSTLPMRASLDVYALVPEASSREALARLREAGVEELPLYASRAVASGVAW